MRCRPFIHKMRHFSLFCRRQFAERAFKLEFPRLSCSPLEKGYLARKHELDVELADGYGVPAA